MAPVRGGVVDTPEGGWDGTAYTRGGPGLTAVRQRGYTDGVKTTINPRLVSWASDLDPKARLQAERTARLPVISGHVALMPDAHLGIGATVGSVVPTAGAIIPSCVGVDIGCGMAAVRTNLAAADLPDSLDPMLGAIAKAVPAGVGQGHDATSRAAEWWLHSNRPRTRLDPRQSEKAYKQFGTLGSGNHFVEVGTDEAGQVWVVLHSGSRGVGNSLASSHIAAAKAVAKRMELKLEDPDLAYFLEGTPEFEHYVADLLWAQDYAAANRETMLNAVLVAVFRAVGRGSEVDRVNCHHNYSAQEVHGDRTLWVTRKGAIRARVGDRGIIPGSMGTSTFIVRGLGEADSYDSCSHGAGRRMSRGDARRSLTAESLTEAMTGRTWLSGKAVQLVDEHPLAYKDVEQVMRDQADLVEVEHRITALLNYKGTS